MICLTGFLLVPEPDRAMVERRLPDHIAATKAEPGCLFFQVQPDRCDPGRWLVAERFADRASFDAHQTRSRASDWGRATAHLTRQFQITNPGRSDTTPG